MELNNLYRQIILESAENPQNYGKVKDANRSTQVFNPSCGDRLNLTAKISEDNRILDIKFEGHGCTISMASASLMTQLVTGKDAREVIALSKTFSDLAIRKKHSQQEVAKLGDAQVLTNIMQFPARIKCATLAWWGLDRLLLGSEQEDD